MPTFVKPAYGAAAAVSIDLANLASSAGLVAGRSSAVIVETTDRNADELVGGVIRVHASNAVTANTQIQVWVWASLDDTPNYPDTITGNDAAVTLTSAGIRDSGLRLGAAINVDATTAGRAYPVAPFSVADLYGGRLPRRWGLWVPHNTNQPLAATGSALYRLPVNDEIVTT